MVCVLPEGHTIHDVERADWDDLFDEKFMASLGFLDTIYIGN